MSKTYICANEGCRELGNMHCSSCRSVVYCSRPCQKAHWKIHRPTCKLLSDAVNQATNQIVNDSQSVLKSSANRAKSSMIFSDDPKEEWTLRMGLASEYISQLSEGDVKLRLVEEMNSIDKLEDYCDKIQAFESSSDIQDILKVLFPGETVSK